MGHAQPCSILTYIQNYLPGSRGGPWRMLSQALTLNTYRITYQGNTELCVPRGSCWPLWKHLISFYRNVLLMAGTVCFIDSFLNNPPLIFWFGVNGVICIMRDHYTHHSMASHSILTYIKAGERWIVCLGSLRKYLLSTYHSWMQAEVHSNTERKSESRGSWRTMLDFV